MKRVPDLLTASRGGIALVIASLGPRALEAVILLTIPLAPAASRLPNDEVDELKALLVLSKYK